MKSLNKYCEDWYDVLEHFYFKSDWVADITIEYKNTILKKYGG